MAVLLTDPRTGPADSTLIIAVTLPLIPVFMVLIGMYTRVAAWIGSGGRSGTLVRSLPRPGVGPADPQGLRPGEVAQVAAIREPSAIATAARPWACCASPSCPRWPSSSWRRCPWPWSRCRSASGSPKGQIHLLRWPCSSCILAPEAYLPLRLVGQHFHAAAEGLGAADRRVRPSSRLRSRPAAPWSCATGAGPASWSTDLVRPPTRAATSPPCPDVSFTGRAGHRHGDRRRTSGGGKSTLLAAILGFVEPASGRLSRLRPRRPAAVGDRRGARPRRLAATGSPGCRSGLSCRATGPRRATPTIGGGRDACVIRARRHRRAGVGGAASDAGVEPTRYGPCPEGLDDAAWLADGSGTVDRTAPAPVPRPLPLIVDPDDLVLLDEPTAALDPSSRRSRRGIDAIGRLAAARGATVIVVAHRPALDRQVAAPDRAHRAAACPRRRTPDRRPGRGDARGRRHRSNGCGMVSPVPDQVPTAPDDTRSGRSGEACRRIAASWPVPGSLGRSRRISAVALLGTSRHG